MLRTGSQRARRLHGNPIPQRAAPASKIPVSLSRGPPPSSPSSLYVAPDKLANIGGCPEEATGTRSLKSPTSEEKTPAGCSV